MYSSAPGNDSDKGFDTEKGDYEPIKGKGGGMRG